ncbi:MATE family efflux transporter [bacterium]|nr:MATE family efflux transporter [bacterium]MBU1063640.1 MATE family efflux transporter [bacterium]MBU1633712.1 MATE family efflux transporter [bacterium]MBU1875134.1 MATE family efflux transporter [bacterium]
MVGMFVMALYNVVDTIFVGRGVGAMAIAGITIVFPIQLLVMAIAMMVGIGGASVISRALGAGDYEKANTTFGNVLLSIVIFGFSLALLGNIFIDELLALFGASDTILPFARDYAQIILLGTVFFSFSMASNNVIRSEGRAKVAMTTMLISAILNIILDPIFIFGFKWGIKGAAAATVISQVVTVLYLIYYFCSGKSSLTVHFRNLRLNRLIMREIVAVGSPSLIRQLSASALVVVINNTLRVYGGDFSIALFGIMHRMLMFVSMPLFGIAQGMQPIVGFNYGAKRYDKAKRVLALSNKATTIVSTVGAIVLFLFPKAIISVFTNDPEIIRMGIPAVRIFIVALPVFGFQVVGSTLFQAIGKAKQALFLTVSRQVFLITLILILPRLYGLTGVWMTFPATDILFFFVTLWLYLPQIRKFDRDMLILQGVSS